MFGTLVERGATVPVRCFTGKWVSRRLLGVNYVRQTMGLTERYQLTILPHNCLCVSAEHMVALLLFASPPRDLKASLYQVSVGQTAVSMETDAD